VRRAPRANEPRKRSLSATARPGHGRNKGGIAALFDFAGAKRRHYSRNATPRGGVASPSGITQKKQQ